MVVYDLRCISFDPASFDRVEEVSDPYMAISFFGTQLLCDNLVLIRPRPISEHNYRAIIVNILVN